MRLLETSCRCRFELRQLKDPPPKEIPAKRKRDHRGTAVAQAAAAGDASPLALVPAKSRCPSEYTFGKLNVREFVQRLHAVGFADARVEGGDDGSDYTIIHLVSLAFHKPECPTNLFCTLR